MTEFHGEAAVESSSQFRGGDNPAERLASARRDADVARPRASSESAGRLPGVARVFVITGPSGVGKGTLIRALMEREPSLELSVSATTRAPRPGEREGVDYHFLSREEFDRRVAAGEFVEHADYAGRSYGTLRSELEQRLADGVPVVLEIEVQGARQVRAAMPEAVQVFIAPPSLDALRTRLIGRGTDDAEEVERRLAVAEEELAAQPEFAHVVVNDRLEDALARLDEIVASEIA
jgi:guanylate kinase